MIFRSPRRSLTNKRFSYTPRYYDPRKDEDLKKRIRLRSTSRRHRRSGTTNVILFIVLLAGLVYFMNLLSDYT